MSRSVVVVGVPMDLGGSRRGVDMGPSAIRYAGLIDRLSALGFSIRDHGNLRVADAAEGVALRSMTVEAAGVMHAFRHWEPRALGDDSHRAHHVDEIVRVCEELAGVVAEIARANAVPIVLGGDHSIAMGTLAGMSRAGRRPGVVYIDAHPDINTPATTISGNVHGMPLAVATGLAGEPFPETLRGSVDGSACALLAIRDVDERERGNIERSGASAITMSDIDRIGVAAAVEQAIAVAGRGDGIHLSLDMDALDPLEAPGVGTPVRGGLSYREAHLAMEMLCASGKLRSIEVAEVNPILDRENRTAALAVELVSSALGETIL